MNQRSQTEVIRELIGSGVLGSAWGAVSYFGVNFLAHTESTDSAIDKSSVFVAGSIAIYLLLKEISTNLNARAFLVGNLAGFVLGQLSILAGQPDTMPHPSL